MAIDPESIWVEKGANYPAPREEVEAVLTEWQVEAYRPLWDRLTRIKTQWYLSRQTGLRAWAGHVSGMRIKAHWREAYTLKEFRIFRLAESWARDPERIDDELASDIAAHLLEVASTEFTGWAGRYVGGLRYRLTLCKVFTAAYLTARKSRWNTGALLRPPIYVFGLGNATP